MASTVEPEHQSLLRRWRLVGDDEDAAERDAETAVLDQSAVDQWLKGQYGDEIVVDSINASGSKELLVRVFGDISQDREVVPDLRPGEAVVETWLGQVLALRGTEFDARLVRGGGGPSSREHGHTFDVVEIPLNQRHLLREGSQLRMLKIADDAGSYRWWTAVTRPQSKGISSPEARKFAAWVRERQVQEDDDEFG